MVSRRISDISCNKDNFDKTIQFTSTPPPRRNRNRKNIWFNPPYSINVKTIIGRIFQRLIDKQFPRHQKYRKLFNRNNLRITYSCVPNMASVIRNHNTSLLKNPTPTDIKECSYRQKVECPYWTKSVYLDIQCAALQMKGQTLTKLNITMELARRTLKRAIITTQPLLEIKIKSE